jgi:hypothetical protein
VLKALSELQRDDSARSGFCGKEVYSKRTGVWGLDTWQLTALSRRDPPLVAELKAGSAPTKLYTLTEWGQAVVRYLLALDNMRQKQEQSPPCPQASATK